MDNGADKKPDYEFSIGGYKLKYSNKLMYAIIAIAPVVGGSLWGAFEAVKGYQAMQKKIETYVAPDLTEFDKRLALVEETTNKTNDYTRDIKNDIKNDIRKLEKVVEQVERDNKQMQREVSKDLKQMERDYKISIKEALDNPMNGK
jgi:Skp family chaperone for outer membrane proteins